MFSPVVATPNEPVLSTSTNRAALCLFLSFFHTLHIAQALFEFKSRGTTTVSIIISRPDQKPRKKRHHTVFVSLSY